MKQLKNNCRYGNISVTPSDWKTTKADISKNWTIVYWFYDDNIGEKRQIRRQGMNDCRTLKERQIATSKVIEDEIIELEVENYNPITKLYFQDQLREISERTPFVLALEFCLLKEDAPQKRLIDLRSNLKYITKAIKSLGYNKEIISNVRLRHIRNIMDWLSDHKDNWSNNQYNVYRTTLIKFFGTLEEYEAVYNNYPKKLKKKQTEKRIRTILTQEEFGVVYNYLKAHYYNFWRFMLIFFYSGARTSELVRTRVKDIDIDNREFRIELRKGKIKKEELRAINIDSLPLWKEVIKDADDECFVFSEDLKPGKNEINPKQITRRWHAHVKKSKTFQRETGKIITADFYAFKHLFLDMVAAANDLKTASKAAGHTNISTTKNHYTVNQIRRDLEEMKGLKVSFIKTA